LGLKEKILTRNLNVVTIEGVPATSTRADLAELFDVTGERIRQYERDGIVKRLGHGTYATVESVWGVIDFHHRQAFGETAADLISELSRERFDLANRVAALEAELAALKADKSA
jgi:hypothetical protein